MHCADELHPVATTVPPFDVPLLLYWEVSGDFCRGSFVNRPSGPYFRKHDGGGLTPSHWAFFNPPTK